MVNQALLKTKIAHINKSVERLSQKANVSLKEFKSDADLQDVIIHILTSRLDDFNGFLKQIITFAKL